MKKILFTLMITLVAINLNANSFYIDSFTNMKNDKNKIIATITKGTKVEVLRKKANMSLVKISGWSYEEEPNLEIFPDIGVTVILSEIKEKYVKMRKVELKKEDEYEEVWLKNSITGWIPSKNLTNDFNGLWNVESKFASDRCGACHSEPNPEHYEAVQFPALVNGMKETAGLSDDEEFYMINYYQKNKIYKK